MKFTALSTSLRVVTVSQINYKYGREMVLAFKTQTNSFSSVGEVDQQNRWFSLDRASSVETIEGKER